MENIIYLNEQSIFDKVLICDHVNKLLYSYQLKNEIKPEINQHKKWETDINKNEIDWTNIYNNTFISTIDSNYETSNTNI